MISFANIGKTFGSTVALRNISFEIDRGEVVGLLGLNGAGKTTAMRLVVGFLHPDKGEILVDGKNPVTERVGVVKNIGYLPENNPLYTNMTVSQYLQFIAGAKQATRTSFDKSIVSADIDSVLNKKIEKLSRGYKQRVGFAAALIGDPDILILDEPTSGLDPVEQEKIRILIKEYGKQKTVVLSTHILSEIEDVANKVIIIHSGMVVYDGVVPSQKGKIKELFVSKVGEES